jgi:hypothetical protein
MRLMGTVVVGGGGMALKVNTTNKSFAPCGAEDGLTLAIWLVAAKTGVPSAAKPYASVVIKSSRCIGLLLSVVSPHSTSPDPRQHYELLPWNRPVDRHARELLSRFGTFRTALAAGTTLTARSPAALRSGSVLSTRASALTARSTDAAGTLRTVFVGGKFAVAVFVELLQ